MKTDQQGLKQENNSNFNKGITKKVVILSIFYFLVTVSYSSFSTVVIYIHQKYMHKGYGQTYLTANSLCSIIIYIFCPFIIQKAKRRSKLTILMCAVGYLANMLIPTIFSYIEDSDSHISEDQTPPPSTVRFCFEILANIIGGASSGLFWVLQGIYMANYCKQLQENKKGKYFSIFNAILNSRIVVGPAITMLGLGLGNQTIYFAILSFTVIISLPIPIFLIPQINFSQMQKKPLKNDPQPNQISQMDKQTQKNPNIFKYLLEFLCYYKKIILVLPSSMLAGLVVGFVASSLPHLLPAPKENQTNDTKVAIALIFFGLGNILGGFFSGYFCDKFSIKIAGYIGNLFVIIGSVAQAICLSIQHTLQRSCLIGLLSGISYSYLFSYAAIICTIYYKGNSFSFATNRQTTSFSYIIYQWSVAFLNNKGNMKLNMTYQCLGLIPLAIIAAVCIRAECNNKQIDSNNLKGSSIQLKQQSTLNQQKQ